MSSKTVLVTGATGFLGRHLTRRLATQGHRVRILARKTSDLSPFSDLDIEVHYGDITDRLALLQATEDVQTLYHLAGFIAYKKADRRQMEKINIEGTANVIDACLTHSTQKLLHLSSVVAVGASFRPEPIDEDFSFNLEQYDLGYFQTKREAEQKVLQAVRENGLNAYLINPSTIYGHGDATKGSRKTQIKVAQGRFKLYPPGGVNVVSLHDVLDAIELCLEKGKVGRRYIICGENLTIRQLFTIIAEEAGVPPPSIPIPQFLLSTLGLLGDGMRKMGIESSLSSETAVTASLYHWFSNQRAMDELGFSPKPARMAISESVSWMKENGLLD